MFNEKFIEEIETEITKQLKSGKNVTMETILSGLNLDERYLQSVSAAIKCQSLKFESVRKAGFIKVKSPKSVLEYPDNTVTIEEPIPETKKSGDLSGFEPKSSPVVLEAPVTEFTSSPVSTTEALPKLPEKATSREQFRQTDPGTGLPLWAMEEVPPIEGVKEGRSLK